MHPQNETANTVAAANDTTDINFANLWTFEPNL